MSTEIDIKQINIEDIKPYPNNPRKNAKAVEKVADSIRQYGFQQPIVVDKDMTIIVGHTRYQASRSLGLDKVPVVIAKDLTDKQADSYRIMDNKSGEWAEWDEKMLYDELDQLIQDSNLQELSYETGFSESELNKLFAPHEDPLEKYAQSTNYRSKIGDLWIMDKHKLLCGDSADTGHLDLLLGAETIDCVWEDPPYGISYQTANSINYTKEENEVRNHKILNDELQGDKLMEFLDKHLNIVINKVKPGGPLYWCHDIRTTTEFKQLLIDNKVHVSDTLIWSKYNASNWLSNYAKFYEPIHYGWKEGAVHPWYGKGMNPNVLELHELEEFSKEDLIKIIKGADKNIHKFNREERKIASLHPTVKPAKLILYHLINSTRPNEIVYDGFAGSGSTLIACERSGRSARCIEIEPKFVDIIINRWQEETGLEAVRQDGVKWNDVIGQEVDDLLDSAYEEALDGRI